MRQTAIDHLLFGVPDLQQGIALIAERLGATPALGGRHPGVGTHNALLSLGAGAYLEVIAPDPAQAVPAAALPYGLARLDEPRLLTWAVRPAAWEVYRQELEALGIRGRDWPGQRIRPDGAQLSWRSVKLEAPVQVNGIDCDGVMPFPIEWQSTAHPARSAPGQLVLETLQLLHPQAAKLAPALKRLRLPAAIAESDQAGLAATIRQPNGARITLT